LIGKYNYGGRITDDWDRRTMKHTLNKFLPDSIFETPNYPFTSNGKYCSPNFTSVENYLEFIPTLPDEEDPEIFGLNQNANAIFQLQESHKLIDNLLLCMPNTSQADKSSNDIIIEIIKSFQTTPLERIDPRESRHKQHDKIYDNGLNHSYTIVLEQEIRLKYH
jgi:dynein heavy chain